MRGIPDTFESDNRAVAPVLGVILLFGIAAIGLSVWQTTVIPSQNADTEFKHYMEVQGDMGDLRQAHLETAASGEPKAPTLKLGVAYTTRVIGVNPPDPSGTVRDEDIGSFSLENATAKTSDEEVSAEDLCGVPPQTDRLRYDPSYNRLSDRETPSVKYENTVLYRNTTDDEEFIVESDQQLIRGSTINILPLQTDLDRTGRSTSIDLSSDGYLVEKDLNSSATPALVVPTELGKDEWEKLLDSQMDEGYVDRVEPHSDGVRIVLNERGDPFPWTVRCAVTTDGEETADPVSADLPPEIINGGVGRGGITDHTVDSNEDKIVVPNGKWINIDSIAGIKYGNAETVPISGNKLQPGDGILMEYVIQDGASNEQVEIKIEAGYDLSNEKYAGEVTFSSSGSDGQQAALTSDAAKQVLDTGTENGPDILNDDNYKQSGYDGQDSVKKIVETILGMEDATLRTTNVAGRVDMKVESGEPSLDIDAEDQSKTIKMRNTSEIEFDVTATGEIEGSENVDLIIRKDGSRLQRADRETLTNIDGEESFTLTWEPDWDQRDNGEYQILVEGESDQEFATVEFFQSGDVRLKVTIDNATSPVDYGDTVETNVTVENVGEIDAEGEQVALSMAGQDGPQPQFDLAAGENTTLALEYDTQENLDPTNTGEKTLKATWNDESTDTETVVVEQPDIILDPQVEDLTPGEAGQNQMFNFTLGEDLTKDDEISVDVSDTGDAVEYDSSDGSWETFQGDGTVSPDIDNGKVYYTVGSDDSEGTTIKFQGSGVDASSADPDIRYDVEYRVESANSYAGQENGDTNRTSFSTTSGEQVEVEIVETGTPVKHGDNLSVTVRAENVGSAGGDEQIQLSLDGVTGANKTVQLEQGGSKKVPMTYDTDQLSTYNIGDAELKAETNHDTDSRTVTIESPVIREPFVQDVPANERRVNRTMGFTLGADTDGATIKINLTDTGDNVSYDGNSDGNWTLVQGNGSISLNTNNNRVTSVKYQTNSSHDLEGDRIRIAADYTDTTDADQGDVYDVRFKLTNANKYPAGETDSTTFEAT